jgi:hypothetical protein
VRKALTVSFENLHDNKTVSVRLGPPHRLVPVALGSVTLAGAAVLLVQDAFPRLLPMRGHDALAAFTLAMIAVAYLIYQLTHWPAMPEFARAAMLAAAFLFWAANQFWPNLPSATLFNDIAIGLFVFDVFLAMLGWPPSLADRSFAETGLESRGREQF